VSLLLLEVSNVLLATPPHHFSRPLGDIISLRQISLSAYFEQCKKSDHNNSAYSRWSFHCWLCIKICCCCFFLLLSLLSPVTVDFLTLIKIGGNTALLCGSQNFIEAVERNNTTPYCTLIGECHNTSQVQTATIL
jgi:hypothetical protein